MSFDSTAFDANASGSKGGLAIHTYKSTDALATIATSGYFNNVATVIRTGDIVVVDSTASTGGGTKIYRLVNTSNVITVDTALTFA